MGLPSKQSKKAQDIDSDFEDFDDFDEDMDSGNLTVSKKKKSFLNFYNTYCNLE